MNWHGFVISEKKPRTFLTVLATSFMSPVRSISSSGLPSTTKANFFTITLRGSLGSGSTLPVPSTALTNK